MILHYHPETHSLYVEFKSTPGTETREITDDLAPERRSEDHSQERDQP